MTTPTYARTHIQNADDLKAVSDAAGGYFFKPHTMRFFNSRILQNTYAAGSTETTEGAVFYFVTSERYSDTEPRQYAVRRVTLTSIRDNRPWVDFETLERFPSAYLARKEAQRLAYNL